MIFLVSGRNGTVTTSPSALCIPVGLNQIFGEHTKPPVLSCRVFDTMIQYIKSSTSKSLVTEWTAAEPARTAQLQLRSGWYERRSLGAVCGNNRRVTANPLAAPGIRRIGVTESPGSVTVYCGDAPQAAPPPGSWAEPLHTNPPARTIFKRTLQRHADSIVHHENFYCSCCCLELRCCDCACPIFNCFILRRQLSKSCRNRANFFKLHIRWWW
jgi:hypothetical protein